MANTTIRELVLLLMPIIGDQPSSPLHLQLLSLVMEIPTNTVIWQKPEGFLLWSVYVKCKMNYF